MSDREKKKLHSRIQPLYEGIYQLKDGGYEINVPFHTLPLRTGTDYYKIILNPLSLHAVGRKIKKFQYNDAQEFIDDLALISWNARYYNEPNSIIYRYAQILQNYINEVVLPKLRNDKMISNGPNLKYPYIGELPENRENDQLTGFSFDNIKFNNNNNHNTPVQTLESTPIPTHHQDYEMSVTPQQIPEPINPSKPLVQTGYNTRQISNPTPISKQTLYQQKHSKQSSSQQQIESGIRRGRPPIIDKPFETRIKLILKGFKKLRSSAGQPLTKHFEKLPDIKMYPDYFQIIQNPISLAEIRIKVRSRKYHSVEEFINDLDLMFANSQQYFQNDPYSEESLDYQQFKKEAHMVIQTELSKSDKEIILATSSSSDGVLRFPLETLEVNGYSYKIGDWVLMKNPADPERPIVGQIFRMWSTEDGKRYCNMCWYYRPEQTCHAVDRLFFQNEVCKTGQYRDHLVDDVVGPCYVLFLTRYQKGDLPEGVIPRDAPWFICEFRYNETSHVFNRIRTWKACLPDEVRDDPEQPLVPLHENRKLIKYESPIKHLLPQGSYVGMAIPEPVPGTANSPPITGSVYLSSPLPNDDLGQYITSPNTVPVPEHDDMKHGRRAYLFTPISQLKGGGGSTNAVYATTPALPHGSPNHEPARPNMSSTLSSTLPSTTNIPTISTNTSYNTYSKPVYPQPQPQPQQSQISQPQLPSGYRSLQTEMQENQAKKLQEQQFHQLQQQQHQQLFRKSNSPTTQDLIPQNTNYHTSTSTYSNLLQGGTLAYGLQENENESDMEDDLDSDLNGLGQFINKKRRIINVDGDYVNELIFYRAPPVLISGSNRIITNNGTELGNSAKYLAWKIKNEKGKETKA
ncbi:unnamed protein product [Candida verbasci]|uniref:Uncharacterized protein n=1 Tax=Candida verbasci TaxID=1227364 RepID=A0A9W4XHG0_9ASCO|nr:unnamed protein product [Candida verbasci]